MKFIITNAITLQHNKTHLMRSFLVYFFLLFTTSLFAHSKLQPGFDAHEHITLFALSRYGTAFADSIVGRSYSNTFTLNYRSPEIGLKNQWSYFLRQDSVGLISIRGTVGDKDSWLANFYAAMIPATGSLRLTDSTYFHYKFANDAKAAVHVGWAVSLGFMSTGILEKIREQYLKGVKNFYIFGHSQGAAIAFLATSYFRHLQLDGKLEKDITFKTYCNAGPKPGNLYYAYDFEFITRNGWAFNVINTADWVPETPYTVQRIQDMNPINPLIHTKEILKQRGVLAKIAGGYYYGKMNRKPRNVQKFYNRVFGGMLYNIAIKKALQQYHEPHYAPTANFVHAGVPIILPPDSSYHSQFKFDEMKKDYFIHHHFTAYYFLLKKYYPF